MLARAQDRVVALIIPEIRNLDAIDEQVDEPRVFQNWVPWLRPDERYCLNYPDAESALASRA